MLNIQCEGLFNEDVIVCQQRFANQRVVGDGRGTDHHGLNVCPREHLVNGRVSSYPGPVLLSRIPSRLAQIAAGHQLTIRQLIETSAHVPSPSTKADHSNSYSPHSVALLNWWFGPFPLL